MIDAGINYDSGEKPFAVDLPEVNRTLGTNLKGPWRMYQAVIPLMKEHGYGCIINVSVCRFFSEPKKEISF